MILGVTGMREGAGAFYGAIRASIDGLNLGNLWHFSEGVRRDRGEIIVQDSKRNIAFFKDDQFEGPGEEPETGP